MRLWLEITGLTAAWSAVFFAAMLVYVRLLRAIEKRDSTVASWLLGLPLYPAMGVVVVAGAAVPALARRSDSELAFRFALGLYALGALPAIAYWSRHDVRL